MTKIDEGVFLPNGNRVWRRNGRLHRENGPAFITINDDGEVVAESWFFNGMHHRTDGPAHVAFDDDGTLRVEEWWVNDKKHREDGPAEIWYRSDGTIRNVEYWLDGIKLSIKQQNQFVHEVKEYIAKEIHNS